jgi:hypothetical protein
LNSRRFQLQCNRGVHAAVFLWNDDIMDKKAQKKIDILQKRIQNLRQQIAGAKKQMDDPDELRTLEKQLAAAEAEMAKLRGS